MSELRGVVRLDGGILSWSDPAVLSDLERILGGEGPARCSIECAGVLELVAAVRERDRLRARRCGTCADGIRLDDGSICCSIGLPSRDPSWFCASWEQGNG